MNKLDEKAQHSINKKRGQGRQLIDNHRTAGGLVSTPHANLFFLFFFFFWDTPHANFFFFFFWDPNDKISLIYGNQIRTKSGPREVPKYGLAAVYYRNIHMQAQWKQRRRLVLSVCVHEPLVFFKQSTRHVCNHLWVSLVVLEVKFVPRSPYRPCCDCPFLQLLLTELPLHFSNSCPHANFN